MATDDDSQPHALSHCTVKDRIDYLLIQERHVTYV